MKRTALLLSLAIATTASYSQLTMVEKMPVEHKVGQIKQMGTTWIELYYKVEVETDTVYTLKFKDRRYHYLNEYGYIEFAETGGVLDGLYLLLKKVVKEKPGGEPYSFQLGKTVGVMGTTKLIGLQVMTQEGAFWLTDNQIDKLFNK